MTDNTTQLVGKFFTKVCALLGVTHIRTTTYSPQTNSQAEQFNNTILTRLQHYAAEHQRDWDTLVHPYTYAYNTQTHRSTNQTIFRLVLSQHSSGPTLHETRTARPTDGYAKTSP